MAIKIFKRLKVFMLVLCTAMAGNAANETTTNSDAPVNGGAILDLESPHPKTKRMPSRNRMEITYSAGVLTLLSDFYDGGFSLRIESGEIDDTYTVPLIFVGESISIDLKRGEYVVYAIGDDGSVLSGIMELN